jgi:hypothetical protein
MFCYSTKQVGRIPAQFLDVDLKNILSLGKTVADKKIVFSAS